MPGHNKGMEILVFNCGSSSLSFKLYTYTPGQPLQTTVTGKVHRLGVTGSDPSFLEMQLPRQQIYLKYPFPDHRTAAGIVFDQFKVSGIHPDLIGHRFVHGADMFPRTAWLDAESLPKMEACLPLASIHNPNSMSVMKVCLTRQPKCRQFVTFDTAFHADLPEAAYAYLLPAETIRRNGYRKYGFHGLSYRYVSQAAAEYLQRDPGELNMIACHLGTGGSSAAAIAGGKSIDTTMGYTPLAGLVMSTRTGDIDAGLIPCWLSQGKTASALDQILNKRSGLLGVSAVSSDIRDLQISSAPQARLAVEMYIHRLKKAIGSLAVELGRVDALIFTDDIGEQNWQLRAAVCREMEWCGIRLNPAANREAVNGQINRISEADSPLTILSMPTDEEGIIGREGVDLLSGGTPS